MPKRVIPARGPRATLVASPGTETGLPLLSAEDDGPAGAAGVVIPGDVPLRSLRDLQEALGQAGVGRDLP